MVKKWIERNAQLNLEYQPWRDFYRQVSKVLYPQGGQYLEDGKPALKAKYHSDMISDAGEYAGKIFAAGMQGGLCSPYKEWKRIEPYDIERLKSKRAKEWIDIVNSVMDKVLANSNWYTSSHMGFEEQGHFGTECCFMERDVEDVIRFYPFTAGQFKIASSNGRDIDTIYRDVWMSAIQIVKQFGPENASQAVKSAAESRPFDYFQVLHIIEPREERDVKKIDSKNMPFRSVWLEATATEKVLRESGYDYFPAIVPRMNTRGVCPYGIGSGHSALGMVNMVQEMEKSSIRAIHQAGMPSMVVPSKYQGIIDLTPASITPEPVGGDLKIRRLFDFNIPIDVIESKIALTEQRIQRTYYNDMFLMLDSLAKAGRDLTATEVIERKGEKLLMLGPTIERQFIEKLSPVVKFTFNECMARGLFPEPPEELQEQPLKIRYVSILAMSQQEALSQGLRAYRAEIAAVAEINPESTIKTDFNEYIQQYGTSLGVPAVIIRTKEETEQIQAAIQQAQEEQAQKEEEMRQAEMMSQLGRAKTQGTALEGMQNG